MDVYVQRPILWPPCILRSRTFPLESWFICVIYSLFSDAGGRSQEAGRIVGVSAVSKMRWGNDGSRNTSIADQITFRTVFFHLGGIDVLNGLALEGIAKDGDWIRRHNEVSICSPQGHLESI